MRLKLYLLGCVLRKFHRDLCTRHCFARCGVDHCDAVAVAGQSLYERIDIANAQQAAFNRNVDIVGRKLYEIEARTQSCNLKRVAHGLVRRQSDVSAHVCRRCLAGYDVTAQTGIVLIAVEVVHISIGDVQSACRKAQLAHVVYPHDNHLAYYARQSYLVVKHSVNRRQCQPALSIAQYVHACPCSPLSKGVIDEVVLLLGCHVLGVLHELVASYCHLATHHEVAVLVDERVERHDILRLLHACALGVAVLLLHHLQSGETGSLALAVRSVVVVHTAVVAGSDADDVKHVVVVIFRVDTVLDERHIAGAVSRSQRLGMLHRAAEVLGTKLLCVVESVAIPGVHLAHHRLINGSQHKVALTLGSIATALQTFGNHRNRVS